MVNKITQSLDQIWNVMELVSLLWEFILLGIITLAIPNTRTIGIIVIVISIIILTIKIVWNIITENRETFQGLGFFKSR